MVAVRRTTFEEWWSDGEPDYEKEGLAFDERGPVVLEKFYKGDGVESAKCSPAEDGHLVINLELAEQDLFRSVRTPGKYLFYPVLSLEAPGPDGEIVIDVAITHSKTNEILWVFYGGHTDEALEKILEHGWFDFVASCDSSMADWCDECDEVHMEYETIHINEETAKEISQLLEVAGDPIADYADNMVVDFPFY